MRWPVQLLFEVVALIKLLHLSLGQLPGDIAAKLRMGNTEFMKILCFILEGNWDVLLTIWVVFGSVLQRQMSWYHRQGLGCCWLQIACSYLACPALAALWCWSGWFPGLEQLGHSGPRIPGLSPTGIILDITQGLMDRLVGIKIFEILWFYLKIYDLIWYAYLVR